MASSWHGRNVGPFRIARSLGEGFGGELFEAEQSDRNRPALLKLVTPSVAASEGFTQRFERDTGHLGSFLHPNVVTLYAAGVDANTYYLAMRPVRGRTLAALIAEAGALSPRRAVELIGGVASAIDEGHRRGLLHRGLAPASILVSDRDGREQASVTDYAVADDTSLYGGMLTLPPGTAPPRVDYAAPEQVRGEPSVAPATSTRWARSCSTPSPVSRCSRTCRRTSGSTHTSTRGSHRPARRRHTCRRRSKRSSRARSRRIPVSGSHRLRSWPRRLLTRNACCRRGGRCWRRDRW